MSNSNLDLQTLDYEQLLLITENAKKLMAAKRHQRLVEAYSQFETIAKECGSSIDEILQVGKKSRKQSRIRYQDPANPKLKWSGYGRKPAWLAAHLEAGKKLEDFLI